MKYVNQRDYPYWLYTTATACEGEVREKGQKTTICSHGCGLCSAIMVADRLLPNCGFGLKEATRIAYESHANDREGTTYKVFAPAFAEALGLELEMTNDPERLRYCLRTGGAATVYIRGDKAGHTGILSSVGHMLTAIGEERDGRIALLDPDYTDERYQSERVKAVVDRTKKVILLCDMDTLTEECAPNEPCFFLFWRG